MALEARAQVLGTVGPVRQAPVWSTVAVVAFTLEVALESCRLLFPNLYGLRERSGLVTVVAVVAAVAVLPLVSPALTRVVGHRQAVVAALVVLAVWRLAVQLLPRSLSASVPMAAGGAVVAISAVVLVLSAPLPGGSVVRGVGLFVGLALDIVLLGAFSTWEPAWQSGVAPALVAVLVAAGLTVSAALIGRAWPPQGDAPALTGGVAVGAVVALQLLFLANPAYVAAAAGVDIGWALGWSMLGVVVALAVGVGVGAGGPRLGAAAAVVAAVVALAIAGFVLPRATGAVVVAVVLVAQAGTGIVVTRALAPSGAGLGRAQVGLALGWTVGLVAILLFQLHYDRPLPIDNRVVTAALGVVGVVTLFGSRPNALERASVGRPSGLLVPTIAVTSLAGVVVAVALGVSGPLSGSPVVAPTATLRVVQWNVRQAVDEHGQLDPAAVADAIAARGPVDVVVLNEVARGWPLSGQLDLATWLSRRLGLNLVWAGAASAQFGNLVLSRLPVVSSEVITLPRAGSEQGRSVLHAVLDRGEGRTVDIVATHLQHRNDPTSMAVRLDEIARIIDRWGGAPATVLAGDLNPKQGDPPAYPVRRPGEFTEIATLVAAGFTTSADLTTCSAPTSGRNCSDYVLVSADLVESTYAVADAFGDHRMIVTEVIAS